MIEFAGTSRKTGLASTKRVVWVDVARGIAILLVVYGHCARGLRAAGYIPLDGVFTAVDYIIYGFHMPLFFFLSGVFGAPGSKVATWLTWQNRFISIVKPYLIWMTLELIIQSSLQKDINAGPKNGYELFSLHTYILDPISPFWFLYSLFACYLFLLIFPKRMFYLFSVLAFVFSQIVQIQILQETTWGLLYFAFGISCSNIVKTEKFQHKIASFVNFILFSCATISISLIFMHYAASDYLEIPVAVTGIGAIFCFSALLCRLGENLLVRSLVFLGQMSMTVLVVHILGTAGARIFLVRIFGVHQSWIHLCGGLAAGVLLPVLLQIVAQRLRVTTALGLPREIRFPWATDKTMAIRHAG